MALRFATSAAFAFLIMLVGCLVHPDWAQANEIEADKPNIVFVIADDCTYRDIGCYGGQAHTPNIDRIATEGMKFERCFQAAPMCSPTRHNIYTGLYPVKSGAYPNHTFANDDVKSIVHYLTRLGYRVGQAGKTHFSPKKVFPFESLGGRNNPDMDKIDAFMKESAATKTPFCLFACSNEPHSPWDKGDATRYPVAEIKLPPYIVDTPVVREEFSRYLAEVTYYDDQVGQIDALLKKHNLTDNTLLVVVSEQGNSFPFAKWTCYDHGLQSAMLVRWPGKVKPGSKTHAMVEYVDITPTFVDAAGGEEIKGLDGRSFASVLSGKTDRHKDFVFGIMTTRGIHGGTDAYAIRSVRDKNYKLILNLNHEAEFKNLCSASAAFQSMIAKADGGDENARHLVNAYQHRPAVELYDLNSDPLEMKNIAGDPAQAETIERLKFQLNRWMEEQGDHGVETEMNALERQNKGNNKKKKANAKG